MFFAFHYVHGWRILFFNAYMVCHFYLKSVEKAFGKKEQPFFFIVLWHIYRVQ